MDTLGKTQAERDHIREVLKKKFGNQEKAALGINISKYTLSRILNGSTADLSSLVDILIAAGFLERKKYRFPKFDLSTFYFINGIFDQDLFGNWKTKKGVKK